MYCIIGCDCVTIFDKRMLCSRRLFAYLHLPCCCAMRTNINVFFLQRAATDEYAPARRTFRRRSTGGGRRDFCRQTKKLCLCAHRFV